MSLHNLKGSFTRAVTALIVLGGAAIPALAAPIKNIVLVHGAWVDGSGWKPVYEVLTKDGYNVTMYKYRKLSKSAVDLYLSLAPVGLALRKPRDDTFLAQVVEEVHSA